ncbi:MAG: hypothetical protein HY552_01150 [Elusimicrobia bacterium]|nr:hypothetical protein [Elusimicrobiota bacterium]
MRTYTLDEKGTVFSFRIVVFLALVLLLAHSRQEEESLRAAPFALALAYLGTSAAFWRLPVLQSAKAQAAAFLWDVAVVSALVYFSEGLDEDLYLMYFLIMFMSGLLTRVGQSFLIGTVSSLVYAALWNKGVTAAEVPLEGLLLRFAFFYVAAFFTAVMAARVRARDQRIQSLELRLSLGRLANGGWGVQVPEGLDPELAKALQRVNAVIDTLTTALERVVAQNAELRQAAARDPGLIPAGSRAGRMDPPRAAAPAPLRRGLGPRRRRPFPA